MSNLKITNVRTIMTAPEGVRLVVVRVETTEPGLYGLGCATYTQRHTVVQTAIEDFLRPFFVGKDPQRIEDLWHTANVNPYWRNGPILNNALSGVDMALWDIKGKQAGMPLYQLLGGKCREAAAVYRHANGRDLQALEDNARKLIDQGIRHIRCQVGGYGGPSESTPRPDGVQDGHVFETQAYCRSVPRMFDYIRSRIGDEIELLHDVHSRLSGTEAVRLAKDLEPFRLFFLEDVLPPEQTGWFKNIRQQSATPLAMGELFAHPQEWTPLIVERLIDFIRCHVSAIGGITPARKLTALCETFGVRTAWHGPNDVSPIGHAANIHLDISSRNFGIQEWSGISEAAQEVFPGSPQLRQGYVYINDKPGLGVDIDEAKAAKYPCDNHVPGWTLVRTPDGTALYP